MRSARPARLPSTYFDGLTRQDVTSAIARLRTGATHKFSDSTHYDLIYEGERYPPKAIFGLAAERVVGRPLGPYDFAGGSGLRLFPHTRGAGILCSCEDQLRRSPGRAYRQS